MNRTATIDIVAVNGTDVTPWGSKKLCVSNEGSTGVLVVIKIPGAKAITVDGEELIEAIERVKD